MSRLQPEQEEMLCLLVEAYRNVDRNHREPFYLFPETVQEIGRELIHPGLQGGRATIYFGDVQLLARVGLILATYDRDMLIIEITPEGFAYYEAVKRAIGGSGQRVEKTVRSYLDTDAFQKKYPTVYKKWSDAESMLWSSDTAEKATTIGHLCREAVQEFATQLVIKFQPPNVDPDPKHTVARVRSVLKTQESRLGDTERQLLDTLLPYWGAVNDLIQRQEHDSQKEGSPLVWEDGGRVVFQTAIVMFEVDRALSR